MQDTEGFSLAHLKELFVAVVILENPYEEALATLRSMKDSISSDSYNRAPVGLGVLTGLSEGSLTKAARAVRLR